MERRIKPVPEDSFPIFGETLIIDDVPPDTPKREEPGRRKPTGPKPGRETPGGWRR